MGIVLNIDQGPERSVWAVPIPQLRDVWEQVRPGLIAVQKKTHPTWIPEEVFMVLAQDRAWLLMGYYQGEYAGFTIVSYERDQFTNTNVPMVWIAYTVRELPGMLEFVLGHVEQFVRERGYSQIIMHSPRPGWRKLGPKLGFHLRDCVYAKDLSAPQGEVKR